MKWFYNMKIRLKLISCFMVIAVLTAIVGISGVINMRNINRRSEDMYNNNFIPTQNLKEIQIQLQNVCANQILAVYERNSETCSVRLDAINEAVNSNDVLLAEYEKTIHSNENRELYNNVIDALKEYRIVRDENLELVKNKQYDQALATLDKVTKAREKSDAALQKLIDYDTNEATQAVLQNKNNFEQQSTVMTVVILVSIILAVILGLVVASIISGQLNQLVKVADKIADGDLDVSIDIDSKDEVGILAKAFMKMADNINEVISNINFTAQQVSVGAKQVSDSSIVLSQGAAEQASSVEELTTALEQVASQTRINADNASHSNELAKTVESSALLGNTQMKEMLHAMQEINLSSANISKIIKVIDEIAFQTNILALNAAVEAARAGQHGKGFAVVAEEVRNLAARSASAAKETTDMIENSIKKAEDGTRIASETAKSLTEIIEGIAKVTNLVSDIANASNEQVAAIEQINQAIIQVSDVVQNNSATSEESAAASEELSTQAQFLKEMVDRFKLRKNTKSYQRYEEISPSVLSTIENMSQNQKKSTYSQSYIKDETNPKIDIALSDKVYGKY